MKNKMLLLVSLLVLLGLSLTTVVSAQDRPFQNIVDITAGTSNFETLHDAIVSAGLADALASADSAYTIFVPTDAAFAALEATNPGLLDTLLADPAGLLKTILNYHVVSGEHLSGELLATTSLPTLQGETLDVELRDGVLYINDAQVTSTDILTKNGVIHVIDAVLMPEAVTIPAPTIAQITPPPDVVTDDTSSTSTATTTTTESAAETATSVSVTTDDGTTSLKTIAEIAGESGNFDQLLNALAATGLDGMLSEPGRFTVFAPTDEAFEALGDLGLSEDELRAILQYHVVNDTITRDQIANSSLIPTMSNGRPLFVHSVDSQIQDISGANVLVYDILASNGIIHVIDKVMIP
jgi:uncharacterized surface protein with fasciclin (FAS1) repeats